MVQNRYLVVFLTLLVTSLGVRGDDDRVLSLLNSLTLKVDSLRERMPQFNILEQAFKLAVLDDRLREMANKMEALQNKMADVEKILQTTTTNNNNNAVQPAVSTTHQEMLEIKLEQYGNKIMEAQNTLRNEARDHLATTRAFKGSLESGMNKIFSKLDTMTKRNREEEDEAEVIDALDAIKKSVTECGNSASSVKERLDDVVTDLLSEWTTAHRQMREMDLKLSHIKNSSSAVQQIDPDEVRVVALRVRSEFQRLEEMEPKIQHAVRVSSDLEKATDHHENLKFLSRNLSSTLKGLQNNLEDRLTSTREGLEMMDEFFVETRRPESRSLTSTWKDEFRDLLSGVNYKIEKKLQEVGDRVQVFLSTEALKTVNDVLKELERGSEAIRAGTESENLWKEVFQAEMLKVKNALAEAAGELRRCTEPPTSSVRDDLKRDLVKRLRNSLG